jgi:hypothetical protein
MKFSLLGFLGFRKKSAKKTLSDYKQDFLVKQGGEQFRKLMEKGIGVPVALL